MHIKTIYHSPVRLGNLKTLTKPKADKDVGRWSSCTWQIQIRYTHFGEQFGKIKDDPEVLFHVHALKKLRYTCARGLV